MSAAFLTTQSHAVRIVLTIICLRFQIYVYFIHKIQLLFFLLSKLAFMQVVELQSKKKT